MSDINKVTLTGRTTADIIFERTESGRARCVFTLAVDGRKKDDVDFVRVQAWGASAENLARYVGKGSKIALDGRLSVRSYEKDGQKRTSVLVVAENISWSALKQPSNATAYPSQTQPIAPNQMPPMQPMQPNNNYAQFTQRSQQNSYISQPMQQPVQNQQNQEQDVFAMIDSDSLPF